MYIAVLELIVLLVTALGPQTDTRREQQHPDIPKGMKQYFVGFLVKPEKPLPALPNEERDTLMQKHVAYIRIQAAGGKYKLAGPFLDNDRVRGMVVVDAASVDEARKIVDGDPMVQSGRLASEIHPAMMADLSCVLIQSENKSAQ